MKFRKFVRALLWVLVVAQMIFIFAMSAQDASHSSEMSGQVARAVATVTTPGFERMTPADQALVVENHQHLTRKAAHVIEYMVLALLLVLALHALERWQTAVLSLALAALFAVFDEMHQLFVDGRGAQVTDVLIDVGGIAVGVALGMAILTLIRRRRARENG